MLRLMFDCARWRPLRVALAITNLKTLDSDFITRIVRLGGWGYIRGNWLFRVKRTTQQTLS